MKLTPVASSNQWAKALEVIGSGELLAPNPYVFNDELFITVGCRDQDGRSLPWLLKVSEDLVDAEVVGEGPILGASSLPSFACNGAIPTQLKILDPHHWQIVFSGFEPAEGRYKLLTGIAEGSIAVTGGPIESRLLLAPLPGQEVLRAGATQSDDGSWVYAAGDGWHETGSSFHPESSLWCTSDPDEKGVEILRPANDEFALTRPVAVRYKDDTEFLFFSRRMKNGDYIQGLAKLDGDQYIRIDDQFQVEGDQATTWMYTYPFELQGQWWAAAASSRLGTGGFVVAKIDFDDVP